MISKDKLLIRYYNDEPNGTALLHFCAHVFLTRLLLCCLQSFVGYEPGACKHNDSVITTLRVLFAPVPIVLLLVGMLLFYFYPINEERRQQIQRELEEAV